MESIRRKRGLIRASRDAMRDFVAIPYNAQAVYVSCFKLPCAPAKRKKRTLLRLYVFYTFLIRDSEPSHKPQAVYVSCFKLPCAPAKRKKRTLLRPFAFGWGTGIRTPEVTESESVALPLGDAPMFTTTSL